MPFTLAHPAAVLPLRRTPLPTAALVMGSMAPDTRLFVPGLPAYDVSHSALGVLTLDPLTAMVLLGVWVWLLRDVVVDLAPSAVRDRLSASARPSRRDWQLAAPAAVVGAATHVGWDALTHAGRWGPTHVAWLRETHAMWPGYTWAQAASGVLGLTVVVVAAVRWLAARPRADRSQGPLLPRPTLSALGTAVLVLGLAAGLGRLPAGIEAAAYHGVVTTLRLAALGAGAIAVVWWAAYAVRARRTPRPSLAG